MSANFNAPQVPMTWPTWPPYPYPWQPPPWWNQWATDPRNPMGSGNPFAPGVGTRAVTPLRPGDFPGGLVPGPGGPVVQPGSLPPLSGPSVSFSGANRIALGIALGILKQYPGGRTRSEKDRVRLASAFGYVLGYLEAKGATQPGSMLGEVLDSNVGTEMEIGASYDAVVTKLEGLINQSQTRAFVIDDVIEIGILCWQAYKVYKLLSGG